MYSDEEAPRASTDWSRIKTRKPENVARRDEFMEAVSKHFDVSWTEMRSPRREHQVCVARFVLYYLLREDAAMSWSAIGRYMDKDHTSCIYGHRKALKFHAESVDAIRVKIATAVGN